MRDSNLMRLLAPQVTSRVGLINRHLVAKGAAALQEGPAQRAHDGIAHVVVDAVANDDSHVIAEVSRLSRPQSRFDGPDYDDQNISTALGHL